MARTDDIDTGRESRQNIKGEGAIKGHKKDSIISKQLSNQIPHTEKDDRAMIS